MKNNRKIIKIVTAISLALLIIGTVIFMLSISNNVPRWLRIIFLILSATLIIISCIITLIYEYKIGSYVCGECKKKFRPSVGEFLVAFNFGSKKKFACPFCGKKGFCEKSYDDPDQRNDAK